MHGPGVTIIISTIIVVCDYQEIPPTVILIANTNTVIAFLPLLPLLHTAIRITENAAACQLRIRHAQPFLTTHCYY